MATNLCNHWASSGGNVTLLTLTPSFEPSFFYLDDRIRHINVDFDKPSYGLTDSLIKNRIRHSKLRKAIMDSNPDCIISHLHVVNVRTLFATIGLRVPVIIVEHGWPEVSNLGLMWRMLRYLTYSKAAMMVAPSQGIIDWFPRHIQRRSRVIPVHVESNTKTVVQDAVELPVGNNIVAVGRMVKIKRFDLLLDAFNLMKRKNCSYLHLVGDGPMRQHLTAIANQYGLSERIKLWGAIKNPWATFSQADVLVMTSESEGFGIVLLEAMSQGVPVVSFDCPVGPREIIRHGIDGILVKPGDVRALARALDDLLADEIKRKQMGSRALEIKERFSQSRIMAMWEKTIAECIEFNKRDD